MKIFIDCMGKDLVPLVMGYRKKDVVWNWHWPGSGIRGL